MRFFAVTKIVVAIMAGFMEKLDEFNALADKSPGFIWRLRTSEGNATYFRPFPDQRVLLNMSVWETIAALKTYVYKTGHSEMLKRRHHWFEKLERAYLALWWIPSGHTPTIEEAKKRLQHLDTHGPTEFAFTFKHTFPPNENSAQMVESG